MYKVIRKGLSDEVTPSTNKKEVTQSHVDTGEGVF